MICHHHQYYIYIRFICNIKYIFFFYIIHMKKNNKSNKKEDNINTTRKIIKFYLFILTK